MCYSCFIVFAIAKNTLEIRVIPDVPDYIEVDNQKLTATFIRTPGLSDVPYPVQMEPNLVVEYYAKN